MLCLYIYDDHFCPSPSIFCICVCACLCIYIGVCICICVCVLICIVFVFWFASYLCVYNDHVCASLPGPPLRARCLQTKMQIRDRVSGFSRKIEQIIAPAPLVTNPVEKYIFFSKKISPSRRASSGTRLFQEKDNECSANEKLRSNETKAMRNQSHFGEVVGLSRG